MTCCDYIIGLFSSRLKSKPRLSVGINLASAIFRKISGVYLMESMSHVGVEEIRRDSLPCSRSSKFSASFWRSTAHSLLAIAAIEAGIWAGLEVSARPTRSTTSVVHRIGQASFRSVKEIGAWARLPFDNVANSVAENDGKGFAALSESVGYQHIETLSGGGSADVFDQNGHMIRYYAVIEQADGSWELMEFIPAAAESASATHSQR